MVLLEIFIMPVISSPQSHLLPPQSHLMSSSHLPSPKSYPATAKSLHVLQSSSVTKSSSAIPKASVPKVTSCHPVISRRKSNLLPHRVTSCPFSWCRGSNPSLASVIELGSTISKESVLRFCLISTSILCSYLAILALWQTKWYTYSLECRKYAV